MSERLNNSPENNELQSATPERVKTPVSQEKVTRVSHEQIKQMADQASEKAKDSSDVLKTIHSESASKKEDSTPSWTSAYLRNNNFKNIMRTTQRKLGSFDKVYSKLIHNSAVERISETSAKTIARPPALLGGALASLIGSSIVLYFARDNGYEVRPSIFIILFLGGYLGGLVVDTILRNLSKLIKR